MALLVRLFRAGTWSRLERAYPNIFKFAQRNPKCWSRVRSFRQHSEAILDESDFVMIGQDVPLIVASEAK